MNQTIFDTINNDIKNNDLVLYMKGTSDTPTCGFSATVVHILKKLGVNFKDINVLADNEIRKGIKQFSNWPTIPQLYIKGEFIGGCDIVKELYETGELLELLKTKQIFTAV
ncbi:MAG: Grx4 family monothiol glutaredoxin [Rickettsiales endosymbiont of Dermacentor nuttalli]